MAHIYFGWSFPSKTQSICLFTLIPTAQTLLISINHFNNNFIAFSSIVKCVHLPIHPIVMLQSIIAHPSSLCLCHCPSLLSLSSPSIVIAFVFVTVAFVINSSLLSAIVVLCCHPSLPIHCWFHCRHYCCSSTNVAILCCHHCHYHHTTFMVIHCHCRPLSLPSSQSTILIIIAFIAFHHHPSHLPSLLIVHPLLTSLL